MSDASAPPDSRDARRGSTAETRSVSGGTASLGQLEQLIEAFCQAWDREPAPAIRPLLPTDEPLRRLALLELVKVDLEYRWQHGLGKRLAEYLDEFPELATPRLPVELIVEEFQARRQAGETLVAEDYLAEYPEHAAALEPFLGARQTPQPSVAFGRVPRMFQGLEPGVAIDDFDLIATLGKGAFGLVFLARQRSMERLVALKISLQRSSEPQALAQLDHDSIVRVFDLRVLNERGLQLLYMQYVAGGTLGHVIDQLAATPRSAWSGEVLLAALEKQLASRGGEPPSREVRRRFETMSWPEVVCWLGERLALALDYAHSRGVLHRDVKPANILLSGEGVPKLADFNISFASGVGDATPEAYFGGSLAYMSPEQLEACHPGLPRRPNELDTRSDLYSLGVVLWELLSGVRPFGDEPVLARWEDTLEAMLARRQAGPVDEARAALPEDCPRGLLHALEGCLRFDRDERTHCPKSLAVQLALGRDREVERLIHPLPHCVDRWLWWAVPAVLALIVLPNIAAGAFNFFYNETQIIRHEPELVQQRFHQVVMAINLLAYPLGIFLIALRTWRVSRGLQRFHAGETLPRDELARLREQALNLGLFATLVGLALWALAGVAYPTILEVLHHAEGLPSGTHAHFFTSLVLCGLIGTAYPFFMITAFSFRRLYAPCLGRAFAAEDQSLWRALQRRLWLVLMLAATVPVLGGGLLGMRGTIDSAGQQSLVVLSLSGLIGLAVVFAVFRPLMNDLDRLLAAAHRLEPLLIDRWTDHRD